MTSPKFFTLLRNEIFKGVQAPFSLLFLILLITPSFTVFIFIYLMPYTEFLDRVNNTNGDLDPFNYFFKWFKLLFGLILMPYYAVFLIWYFEIERKAKGWKYLCSFPIKFQSILIAKVIFAVIFLAVAIGISCISFFVSIIILSSIKSDWAFGNYPMLELGTLSILFACIFIASLPALVILFVVIMLYDNPGLVIPVSIGSAIIPSTYNPFHFHITALESYWRLHSAGSINYFNLLFSVVFFIFFIFFIIKKENVKRLFRFILSA